MTKHTALYEQHLAANAKMVDFYGWEMPLHYGSQIEEHQQVRRAAGMFDVSHMTIVDLLGVGGRQFLRYLLCNDIDKVEHNGKAIYSCMLNLHGGIIDDLMVYARSADNYRVILNAATCDKDLSWLQKHIEDHSVGIQHRSDLAMIAIQGPTAIASALKAFSPAQMDGATTLQNFESVDVEDWLIARTGYTGEDGLEVILPGDQAPALWQALLDQGIKPCGLGARDTLRLEAGMMLYGQDMDENTTPLESGLGWTIAWEPQEREFIGRGALQLQKQSGVKHKMVGLVLSTKGVMRAQQKVIVPDVGTGIITSGGFSPTLNCSIALARVPKATKEQCFVEIRGEEVPAQIVKPRFVKNNKSLLRN